MYVWMCVYVCVCVDVLSIEFRLCVFIRDLVCLFMRGVCVWVCVWVCVLGSVL